MSRHLTPEEFVDALDAASPASASHLAACAECREELTSLQATLGAARGARETAASEPSPLFWDHFSARVKQATADERVGSGWSWGSIGWKPVAALTVAAGALAIGLYLRPAAPPAGPAPGGALPAIELASTTVPAFEDDGSWSLVTALASELDWNELSQAATPAEGVADAMIDELTSAQREALARLLQKEMGDL
jgi:hypothetical protein